jgi:hypothetical protein
MRKIKCLILLLKSKLEQVYWFCFATQTHPTRKKDRNEPIKPIYCFKVILAS